MRGTLDLDQFWPHGTADADTTKLVLDVGATEEAFQFRPHAAAPFRATQAFEGAMVHGRVRRPAIDEHRRVVVRLQGLDAPELHYAAAVPRGFSTTGVPHLEGPLTEAEAAARRRLRGPFRQWLAETAARALADLLRSSRRRRVRCTVLTAVDEPGAVFDTYGRLVGDVHLRLGAQPLHLNRWLLERGWAVAAFYDSMSAEEIRQRLDWMRSARRYGRGLHRYLRTDAGHFEALPFRAPEAYDELARAERRDRGPVVLPKLFRRFCSFRALSLAGLHDGSFLAYLRGRAERCLETADVLAASDAPSRLAPKRWFHDYVTHRAGLNVAMHDLVFCEAASKVIGPDGRPAVWHSDVPAPPSRIRLLAPLRGSGATPRRYEVEVASMSMGAKSKDPLLDEAVERAIAPYRALVPPDVLERMRLEVELALLTHPVGRKLMDATRPRMPSLTSDAHEKGPNGELRPVAAPTKTAGDNVVRLPRRPKR